MFANSHSAVRGKSLGDVFIQIKKFLSMNPSEFIIIKLQADGIKLPGFCKNILCEYIVSIFGESMINQQDRKKWFKLHKVTIGDVRRNNKKLLIIFNKEIFDGFLTKENENFIESPEIAQNTLKNKGIFDVNKFILDYRFCENKANDLLEKMEASFVKVEKGLFRVSQYVLTPKKEFKLKYLMSPPTIFKLDKSQFNKNNCVMNHIVESINEGQDVNIGTILKPLELSYITVYTELH